MDGLPIAYRLLKMGALPSIPMGDLRCGLLLECGLDGLHAALAPEAQASLVVSRASLVEVGFVRALCFWLLFGRDSGPTTAQFRMANAKRAPILCLAPGN